MLQRPRATPLPLRLALVGAGSLPLHRTPDRAYVSEVLLSSEPDTPRAEADRPRERCGVGFLPCPRQRCRRPVPANIRPDSIRQQRRAENGVDAHAPSPACADVGVNGGHQVLLVAHMTKGGRDRAIFAGSAGTKLV